MHMFAAFAPFVVAHIFAGREVELVSCLQGVSVSSNMQESRMPEFEQPTTNKLFLLC